MADPEKKLCERDGCGTMFGRRNDKEGHENFRKRRYCSKRCGALARRRVTVTEFRICEFCGATFEQAKDDRTYHFDNRHYCSQEHRLAARKRRIDALFEAMVDVMAGPASSVPPAARYEDDPDAERVGMHVFIRQPDLRQFKGRWWD